MPVVIDELERSELAAARALLAAACPIYRAAEVAEEKLFGAAPAGPTRTWAARDGDALVGVAVVSGRWVRLLAVTPAARGRGVGTALLGHAEAALVAASHPQAGAVAQPGNYLAPGLDVRDPDTIAWLGRRGWVVGEKERFNALVALRDNPRVSADRAAELVARAAAAGYTVRRASLDEGPAVMEAVNTEFGMAWPFEVGNALAQPVPAVHLALDAAGAIAGFAAHDGNNRGLGWFGPTGTWPAHRGRGLGEALLVACLVDIAADHEVAEIAWVGPRDFYVKTVGVAGERRFVTMTKELTPT